MRILASVVLVGLVFANISFAKAMTLEVSDQNIQQKSNLGEVNINSTNGDIKSYNRNFTSPVYLADVSPALVASYSSIKFADYASVSNNDFVINASAYTAAADECGKSDGITASGVKVKEDRTLACPKHYPFGTKIEIDGFGTYVCEDRGGAIKGNHFDIYMQTKKQAYEFGRRNLNARIVE